ncbi:glycosyltransferase family 2 protein [Patescibacteria group bacterium]|nr:glycosyltransferase family 2 protein [Patescibacteria group bacterium]MBU0776929.1 glycosyltransferase family 2 protein [Patescibacteria group bacterium]MBU0845955.1 glycosyltransferase family 2 protein [Patescibacteria group bacterium]MBU0922508.1 glycosyltransferase family 2 protein [Patescibacteria group bacterium]MBU1066314.1 glycosyltransferase family 2 protein [Patescibacteria group bacterium]
MDLSIVIPAYNEEGNIKDGALKAVNDYLIKKKYSWEVLIVDDASKDETIKLAEAFAKKHSGFRILKEPHRGKGGTVIAGVLAAKGEIVLFTDMDQATPINQVEKLLPKFKDGYNVVIGSRVGRKGAPILRKIMAYGFTLLRIIILRLPYKDTQCGFKALKKDAAEKVFKRMKVFGERAKVNEAAVTAGFDLELLYIARKLNLKVAEVPVVWHHKGTERVSAVKDSWEGLRDMIQVRTNALLGKYKD